MVNRVNVHGSSCLPYDFTDRLPEQAEVDVQHADQVSERNRMWILSATGSGLEFMSSIFQPLQPEQLVSILSENNEFTTIFNVYVNTERASHVQSHLKQAKNLTHLYCLKLSWYLLSCETDLYSVDTREVVFK